MQEASENTDQQTKESTEHLSNLWAIILGGSSGLGLATAQKLASQDMNICIVHRDRKSNMPDLEKRFNEMRSNGVEVLTFNSDALSSETIEMVLSKIPDNKVKLLLHSIAKGSVKPMLSEDNNILSREDLDITIHAMGTSWYQWTQKLIQHKKFTVKARNMAFTSEGNTKVWKGYGAVSAAKASLEALMRNMAVELAPIGITSNCIQAGATITPSFNVIPGSEKLAEFARKRNPFKRLTTPKDVANVVYLMCRPESDWINGTVIKVDGGESIQ
ncbi:SDR family NAD(P)-dependent oxidoreductase [Ulvibacter antarcticus]|uniref:NAD(P)-dependent dehydrogenase (Short-subunit alcohol dehydrogenase family) n=1 Tax=Ulvibacter antarcticus TaxID=442714 RepID=A0A3L9YU43_9FLAO|nr:SDR family oxidoreductase [Ulvibacter antarcticus]RMA64271.1 NAD(P)-dependent dehydrogenase (short-subunit alcohol dehydrogenase family) [Ulvibacter antarcticus]